MQDVGEQLQPVDDSRSGAGEVGGRVDGDDLAGADRAQLLDVHLGLTVGDLGVVAARHHQHDVGRDGGDLLPAALLGVLAGQAEHVVTAGEPDQLRGPVARGEGRIQPLQRDDPGTPCVASCGADAIDPPRGPGNQLGGGVLGVGRLGDRAGVPEHLADRVRIQRDDHRLGVDLLRDRAHVVIGDRAHRAQRLGDDQVGLELVQRVGVELVDRLARHRALLDGRVDLSGAEAAGQPVTGDLRQSQRLLGIVALVRDGDEIVAEAERVQHLGGGWNEADDAHDGAVKGSDMPPACRRQGPRRPPATPGAAARVASVAE